MKDVFIIVVCLILLAVIWGVWKVYELERVKPSGEQTVCTLEAKLCPDGSYVGRTGPNCEFSACPGE